MDKSDRGGRMNLKELITKGESETQEFKKSLSEWKEIVETVWGAPLKVDSKLRNKKK